MKLFLFTFSRRKMKFLAIFIIGFMLGASSALLKAGRELDNLLILNNQLSGELTDKENQVRILKEKLNTQTMPLIEKISLHINLPDKTWAEHKAVQEKLEQELKKILNPVLGLSIDKIEPGIIQALLHQRIIHTNEGVFTIEMNWLIIAPVLEVDVSAKLK